MYDRASNFFGRTISATILISSCLAGPVLADFEAPSPQPGQPTDDSSLKVRAFFGYDSNVQYFNDYLGPTPIGPSSTLGGVSIEYARGLAWSDTWDGGFVLRGDILLHTDSEDGGPVFGSTSDYDRYSWEASIFAGRNFSLANGTPGRLNTSASIRQEKSRDVSGVGGLFYSIYGSALFDVEGPWNLGVQTSVNYGDFDVEFPGDPESNRDGTFFELIGSAEREMNLGVLKSVLFHFGGQVNNAKGSNWSFNGIATGAQGQFQFSPKVSGSLGIAYTNRNYDGDFLSAGFTPPGRLDQQVTSIRGGLVWQLGNNMAADLSASREFVRSNSSEFEADRTTVTLGLTVQLQ